ncbi:MAG: phospholipid methyltransferase [Shinella sp.]|nr:phospholipid methyltransferase [Shinella sp.]
MTTDACRFFSAWMQAPLTVASVLPSGNALARLIVSEIAAETGPVIELGVGTGVFTRALLRKGVSESSLTLVESTAEFATLLGMRFPAARVLCIDAADLGENHPPAHAGAAVSGLPLLSMRAEKVAAILSATFSRLRPEGAFYQFTYGFRCPVPRAVLDDQGLGSVRIGGTFRNLPPAAVYRIARA